MIFCLFVLAILDSRHIDAEVALSCGCEGIDNKHKTTVHALSCVM